MGSTYSRDGCYEPSVIRCSEAGKGFKFFRVGLAQRNMNGLPVRDLLGGRRRFARPREPHREYVHRITLRRVSSPSSPTFARLKTLSKDHTCEIVRWQASVAGLFEDRLCGVRNGGGNVTHRIVSTMGQPSLTRTKACKAFPV